MQCFLRRKSVSIANGHNIMSRTRRRKLLIAMQACAVAGEELAEDFNKDLLKLVLKIAFLWQEQQITAAVSFCPHLHPGWFADFAITAICAR